MLCKSSHSKITQNTLKYVDPSQNIKALHLYIHFYIVHFYKECEKLPMIKAMSYEQDNRERIK